MNGSFSASAAWKIAWREARASTGKLLFVVLAVGVGVGALAGVKGFGQAFENMLLRDARQLMAADLSVRLFNDPGPEQQAALDRIVDRGAERTWITETLSMMSAASAERPLLVSVKAVDPREYPFYGEIRLRPEGRLEEVLQPDAVVAAGDLLLRLGLELGGRVRLGDADFHVAAEITLEPDRMTGSLNVGPRVMISREGLDRAALIRPGSRASQRFLFRLPAEGLSIAEVRRELEGNFPGDRILDYQETHPTIRRGLERSTRFLSLVSLVAIIVGAMGVAMAMHSHLQQRLDSIAIMKCLGARSSQIIRIYLIQTLGLGLMGSLAGILLGYGVQALFPILVARYFPQTPRIEWQPDIAALAIVIGILTTLLFTLPPLLSIRHIRPALIFRREVNQGQGLGARLRRWRPALGAGAVIVLGLAGVAGWLGRSAVLGTWFAGGLVVSLITLSIAAWALLAFLKRLPRLWPGKMPPILRQGVANLHRPGIHAGVILVSLGIGVTFTLSIYLVQSSMLGQIIKSAPPNMPNIFYINVTEAEREGLLDLAQEYSQTGEPDLLAAVAARLKTVDGVPLEELNLRGGPGRWLRSTTNITWMEERPDHIDLISGRWWSESGESPRPRVSARRDMSDILGIGLGSELTWAIGGQTVKARVVAFHQGEGFRPGSTIPFILNPEALAGFPATYYGGVKVAPERAAELQREAYEKFPAVTVINASDVLEIVQEVVDQIGAVVRFISGFAILAGAVILVSAVMATRFRRIREVAILKTLGATRRRVARVFSVEFLVLGSVAGLMGSLLATGFSWLLSTEVLDSEFQAHVLPNAVTIVLTALLANAAGWLGSVQVLGKKPIEVLRDE